MDVTPPQSFENGFLHKIYFIHVWIIRSHHSPTSWNVWRHVTFSFNLNAFSTDWHPTFPRPRNANLEVEGEGDTLSYIPWSGRMVIPNNSCTNEINLLKESIVKGLRWCDTFYSLIPTTILKVTLYITM
jgi:hypothetical protein